MLVFKATSVLRSFYLLYHVGGGIRHKIEEIGNVGFSVFFLEAYWKSGSLAVCLSLQVLCINIRSLLV
jgi:hypothetical protein